MEALRRARYKFPGRQKIIISKKWGFTNVNKEEYLALKADKRVLQYVLFLFRDMRGADHNVIGTVPTSSTSAPRATSSATCATSSVPKRLPYDDSFTLLFCTLGRIHGLLVRVSMRADKIDGRLFLISCRA
jgi:hypothetical protein